VCHILLFWTAKIAQLTGSACLEASNYRFFKWLLPLIPSHFIFFNTKEALKD